MSAAGYKHLSLCCVAFSLLLCGCAPRQQAQIVEREVLTQRQKDERIGGQVIRLVQPGDTLYSIAFAFGLDVNNIAAWNGIQDTSKVYVGQRIRLTMPIGFRAIRSAQSESGQRKQTSKRDRSIASAPVKKQTALSSTLKTSKRIKDSKLKSASKVTSKSGQSTVRASISGTAKSNAQSKLKHVSLARIGVWQWPLRGTLVKRFDLSKGQQGIRIQGQRGQAIKASAAGEVVYAGNSLKGYGNLLIIKHSSEFLSAYAHNQSISVQEGEIVQSGQVIAKLGADMTGQAVSQFQIRQNGNPVDPMNYLR